MKRILFIFLLIACCLGMSGQSKLSPYTQKYLVSQSGEVNATRAGTVEYVSAYIHVTPDMDLSVLEELGVKTNLHGYCYGSDSFQPYSGCCGTRSGYLHTSGSTRSPDDG